MTRLLILAALAWFLSTSSALAQPNSPDATEPTDLQNGLIIRQGELSARLHGRVQLWGGYAQDDALLSNGDAMEAAGFRMRRVRFGIEGQLNAETTYGIELDIFDQERNGGPLHEAWIDYTLNPLVGILVGSQDYPVVYGDAMSSKRLSHLDRARAVYALSPSSPMGLTIHSKPWDEHILVLAGIYNGLQRKSSFYQGFEGVGISLGNRLERLSYAGRIQVEPFTSVGDDDADLYSLSTIRVGLGGGAYYNDGKSIQDFGYSAYFHLKGYGFHLLAEGIADKSEPQAKPTTTNTLADKIERLGVHASVGYMLIPSRLGLAVRLELLDDNLDLETEGDEVAWAVTATWYEIEQFLKAQIEYQHREERYGVSLDNDAVLGGVQLAF